MMFFLFIAICARFGVYTPKCKLFHFASLVICLIGGAHHITTMKDQVMVNRNVKDENSSKNRKRFNRLSFSIILCKRLSIMSRSFYKVGIIW